MEFGDRYDLLESITTGAVETFIASDKAKGERVLVHILHCEPQKPNQPTVQWVLENFRKAAPEPAGLVLETGKYSGTLYAYVVTKVPEDSALRSWVTAYNGQTAGIRPVSVPDVKSASRPEPPPLASPPLEMPAPTQVAPARSPSQVPVQFTQMFRTMGSQSTPPVPEPPKPDPQHRPLPSLDAPGHSSGPLSAPMWDTLSSEIPRAPKDNTPKDDFLKSSPPTMTSPAGSFTSAFEVKGIPPEPMAPPAKDGPKAGDFTSFFQGPFRPDVPADLPPATSAPVEPRRKSAGDFTQMFGSGNSPAQTSIVPEAPAKKDTPGTGFTGWFSDPGILTRTPESPAAAPIPATPPAAIESLPSFPPTLNQPIAPPAPPPPLPAPVAPAAPAIPSPVASPTPAARPPAFSSSPAAPEGATGAFSMPSLGEPVHSQPAPPPAGPSPYTQIINMRNLRKTEEAEEKKEEAEDSKSSGLPALPKPKAPKIAAPAAPKFKAPAPPKDFKAPKDLKAPKAPKVDASKLEAAKPPSYWPLVLTLTALFFVAVLLVLYFVLKH